MPSSFSAAIFPDILEILAHVGADFGFERDDVSFVGNSVLSGLGRKRLARKRRGNTFGRRIEYRQQGTFLPRPGSSLAI